ncbi:flavin reductase family protein [Oscillospiraceae bacterium OttesenSCG-928-G22]|nr:flavin reductase family protein [Oscillospiraceae bacterium OttesenSCG-928-G22]
MRFTSIPVKELTENPFSMIGDKWMLITAKKPDGSFNTMTASWGMLGVLWRKPVCEVFVREERYTFEFMEAAETFTLSVFDESYRSALNICGTASGRDGDKIKKAGLTPFEVADGAVGFEEASLMFVCRKIYRSEFVKEKVLADEVHGLYETGGYHRVFIGEILDCLKKG